MVIRAQQMGALEEASRRQFEEALMAHSKAFSPRLCALLGDQQLHLAIRSAVSRANGYGFTNRGPIRLFIELMFLCGSGFDTDPQYPAIGQVLRTAGDQMRRAQQIHQGTLSYLENVAGPDNANVRRALRELSALARTSLTFSSIGFASGMVNEMTRIFPEKTAYTGEAGLKALIREATAEAQAYRFSNVRQQTLIVVLMFAFGHGCSHDPLYPWIQQTLQDPRIVDSDARAARLEKKAVTWLDHVLANESAAPA